MAQAQPTPAGDDALRAIDPRNAFLMDSMLRDVTIYGTAGRASVPCWRESSRADRNDQRARRRWFCGDERTIVGRPGNRSSSPPKSYNAGETGGSAALPMWIGYMARALKDVPESSCQ